jgi:phosphomevalonate kinase
MRIAAPGKVLLTGAYAVLEGAPALVLAVDRYAIADTASEDRATHEVREALGRDRGPRVDVTALHDGGAKLGLGSSAAGLVATLGAIRAERGDDLSSPAVRAALFADARAAHERAQRGGSGVDVAASVYGGTLSYTRGEAITPVSLPTGIVWSVLWSGTSARTSDLRARVDALRVRDERAWKARSLPLADASRAAARACSSDDADAFLSAASAFASALAALGQAADAPIVPPSFAALAALATAEAATFFPSGAGGGDVGVHLGRAAPSERFLSKAKELAMHPLGLAVDRAGVHRLESR